MIFEWLILTYTNPGETVLDPFMGAGATAVACALTGRSFIGYERESGYVDTARFRVREAIANKEGV